MSAPERLSPDAEKLLLALCLKGQKLNEERLLELLFGWSPERQLELRKELVSRGFIEPERTPGSEGFA